VTISPGIQKVLEGCGDCHSPLGSDPAHRFRQIVAFLRHKKLAHYGCRAASSRAAVNQHGRMLRSQLPEKMNRPQENFRAIPGTIDQLNDLNAVKAKLLRSYPFHAAIEA
jgi:hypothetical protein